MTMLRDDDRRWPDDRDLDRVRATPRGVVGGWLVVAAIAALIFVVPPTVNAADVALEHAKQNVQRVEHHLAQSLRLSPEHVRRC
jgi:hypothetical protein